MKLLYLPNEKIEGDQYGPRSALLEIAKSEKISKYGVFSYLVRREVLGSYEATLEELVATARTIQPDVILIQHLSDRFPLTELDYQRLQSLPSRPKIVYHDGDAYGALAKRIDSTVRTAARCADMVILTGLGDLASLFRRAGARCIRWAPDSFDPGRFGLEWKPKLERQYDAIMIGNLFAPMWMPIWYLPGGRRRKQTAKRMHEAFGKRFTVYGAGRGWIGEPYVAGPLPYDCQEAAVQQSWISVNWHTFDHLPMYASDRLPISLAAGVPHITNYQPGYEHFYGRIPGLFLVATPQEAQDVATYIISQTLSWRIDIGLEAAAFARAHLDATTVYRNMLTMIGQHFQISRALEQ